MQAAVMEESNPIDNVQAKDTAATYNYDDLFPALPESTTPILNNAAPKNMRVGSSVVTQVFHVPCEERKTSDSEKFGEGESLRICQLIMKDTGKQNEVLDARRKILVHFQTQASKQVEIPKEHHRVILGKKGERLRELEKLTATKINVPNISEESDTITITGTKEGIEKAEHEIRTMSDEQSKKAFERISIPKVYHPFILGPFNENLNKMMEETGAKINVPPQTVFKDEITITGEKDSVLAAKRRIEDICKEMEKKCSTVSVEVPKGQHRYIIGQRGSTIQEILKATGVSVEMPPSDTNTETITLRGPQTAMGNALNLVYHKANSMKSVTIHVPNWIHKYIIGKRGANMKEFEQDYPNVNVNCLGDEIKLEGPPETVEKAQAYLEGVVHDYNTNYTFVVIKANPSYYKHIIGKGGANINRLKDDLKVTISIEEKEGQNNIRIEGPKEGVAQAQSELQEQIDKLENEKAKDVIIDRRLYRQIIGAKGEKIREIKDRYRQVQITIPSQNENVDIVKLRGPKEDVDKCHKDLMKLVKEIQESSHRIEVPIFKQFHKFIIGKGGARIKKIRDETQTKIDLPAEGDTNEVIVITGKKENVLEARDRIQKIQDELSDIITEEVQIPPKFYNSIIGTGGKLISAIMEECGGVSIKFPPSESKSDKVTIRGPKDDVEKAKAQLLELANERQAMSFTAEVRAKQQHHRFLIGKNGASIRKIREATGARIMFPSPDDEDKEVITIMGKEESVRAAKEQLETIIKDIDKVTEGEISVDPKYHKHFVAKRGEILHRIGEECGGVMISFPRSGVDSDRVTLKGAKDCIEAAKQRILEIVADLESQVTIECIIPQQHHRTIMGSRGAKIQAITSEFDVQIKFPDRETGDAPEGMVNGGEEAARQRDIIRITGRPERCEAAKQALIDLIPITAEVNVPFDLHRSIIGQKGANVRDFMNRYNVHVELSPPELKLDVIKIKGTPANVEEAKEALMKQVEEFEADRKDRELRSFELKIDVDPKYHPKIIGRRGAVVNKIRNDFSVNISFPKRDDTDDRTITITGYEKNANEAKEEIMKMVNELNEQVEEVFNVDRRVHPRLIGQRGRSIRKIMEDYKVDIKFPKAGDENPDAVTIIGMEEAVLEAKDHILNLEEEYLQDVVDTVPSNTNDFSSVLEHAFNKTGKSGFVVQGAPWESGHGRGAGGRGGRSGDGLHAPNTQSHEDFPDFGIPNNINNENTPISSAWGQRR
ncbi:unnamed protein product [Hermetia illucens]|uniref:K Homology domain-containing protein n=1 Tax=Hermetia illucens TaxID=343691 RepID=A0A7R8YLF5_HERIL|nr:unnamed protein product [Hermetia illucens]